MLGKDVAEILGYKNGSRDINAHVDEEDRLKYQISTAGQKREQAGVANRYPNSGDWFKFEQP